MELSCWTSMCHRLEHAREDDINTGQIQVVFGEVYKLSAWYLDCDNALYTYHIHLTRPSYASACSNHTKVKLRSSTIDNQRQCLAELQLTFLLGEHGVRSGMMSTG
jgi:TRAP-type mannitol/chloroaromatic compound transport system permease small subunit